MEHQRISDLLGCFTVDELGEALFQAGLPQSGTKAERIHRLSAVQQPPAEILDLFLGEALRIVCSSLGVQVGRKDEMIVRLISWCHGTASPRVSGSELGPLVHETMATASPQPTYRPATREEVMRQLRQLTIPRRKAQSEADADGTIGSYLATCFEDVAPQYAIGGYLGLKIDMDIGNGKVGVEVKLADSLLNSAAEIQRLIGQAFTIRSDAITIP